MSIAIIFTSFAANIQVIVYMWEALFSLLFLTSKSKFKSRACINSCHWAQFMLSYTDSCCCVLIYTVIHRFMLLCIDLFRHTLIHVAVYRFMSSCADSCSRVLICVAVYLSRYRLLHVVVNVIMSGNDAVYSVRLGQ